MKKIKLGLICLAAALLVLAGCGKSNYVITSSPSKTTIEVKNVDDGTYGESGAITMSKKKPVKIESALDSGQLKIEFGIAENFATGDEADDYRVVNIGEVVTIGPGDNLELNVDSSEYILQFTAIGKTNGTVTLTYK